MDDQLKSQYRAFLESWKIAGAYLEAEKEEYLRNLSDEEARKLVQSLFSFSGKSYISPERLNSSGLLEQQRYFAQTRIDPIDRS